MVADLPALALTLAMEWPLLAWGSGYGLRPTALLCLAMNGTSWGTAMAVLSLWPLPIPVVESAIILTEALILHSCAKLPPGRSFLWSLVLNLVSWQLGTPLLRQLLKP
jgi:hypothetical protein